MSVFHNNVLSGAAGQAGGAAAAAGPIKSVRFNSGDSAYLNRTPSSAGNRKTWTFSTWAKLSKLSSRYAFFQTSNSGFSLLGSIEYQSTGKLSVQWIGSSILYTDSVLRDPSAWYHIVVSVDTTQATQANRVRLYLNGVEQTFGSGTYPAQNADTGFNAAQAHNIGAWLPSAGVAYSDFYLADCFFIDGQQLDPTSFGAFDDNGVWQAAAYSGTFGTNGFHLFDFANESGIGNDSSGNDNDWTVNNLSSTEVSSITNPTWYAASSYYSDVADVIANGTNKGSGAWTASSEFVYLVVNDGGTPGSNNVSAGNMGITWVMYRNTGGTLTRQGSFGATEFPSFDWSDSTGTYTIANSADYYLFSDEDANPPTNGAFSGSIPALTTASFRTANDINKNLDVLRDVPTNGDSSDDSGAGGEVSGNYATLNPLDRKSTVSLSNGNLDATTSTTGWAGVKGTMGVSSGKYYFEATANGSAANKVFFGICASSVKPDTSGYLQDDSTQRAKGMLIFCDDGKYQLDGNSRVSYSSSMADGDVIAVAYDLDGNTVQFYKNGSALGSIDISSSPLASTTVVPLYIHYNTNTTYHLNFGQRAFAYSAPSGYKALCTTNLPDPTIADGSDYFDAKIWTGDGTNNRKISTPFSPDWVWVKDRGNAYSHRLFDTVRGDDKGLVSNSDAAEGTVSLGMESDGFVVEGSSSYNDNTDSYVAWTWDAGSSTASNTDGSITTSVRANQTAGFSIVSYTGTGANATIGHGLNAAPEFAIFKARNGTNHWLVYHKSLGNGKKVNLNLTDAASSSSTFFQNTDPTSSVMYLGTESSGNWSGYNMIGYLFSGVAGYSAFGSYTGNGDADGPFVYTGFKPALVILKRTDGAASWYLYDYKRDGYNAANKLLYPNLTNVEANNHIPDFLSNGFKIRTVGTVANGSGNSYIYMAFAENPFQANGGLAR